MSKTSGNQFHIGITEFIWSVKLFAVSAIAAFILSIAVYVAMMIFAEPQPVNTVISATVSTAMAKVEVGARCVSLTAASIAPAFPTMAKVELGARYVSPMWSIFVFNAIAIFTAFFGTGFLSYIHNVLSGEFSFRSKHRTYAGISIRVDKLSTVFYRYIRHIVSIFDPRFYKINVEEHARQDDGTSSVWDSFGFTRNDY